MTGLSANTGPEVEWKRLGLFKEIAPSISRVAWFGSKLLGERDPSRKHVQAVAMMAEASEKHLWAVFGSLRPADFNLKTAKALGLTIPPSLLGRADEVIR